jgi:hypothetical protein
MMLLFWSYARLGSMDTRDSPLYRADLLAEMQDDLRTIADIKARQEVERETVEGRDAQRITAEAA